MAHQHFGFLQCAWHVVQRAIGQQIARAMRLAPASQGQFKAIDTVMRTGRRHQQAQCAVGFSVREIVGAPLFVFWQHRVAQNKNG